MKEGRDLVKEAIADAKSLKEAAVESAKKEIVESMAPAVRKLLEKKLNERARTQGYEHTREEKQDYGDHATDESVEQANEELTLEDTIQEFFPAEGIEEKKMNKSSKSAKSSKKNEAVSSAKSSKSESIEISEAELRKVYETALQTEVSVKKGFGDVTAFVELGGKTGGNDHDPAEPPTGKKSGEHHFEEETPPHKQNWIPEAKELHGMLKKGLAENKALRENLRKAAAMIETLGKKLHEVNLFNSKVLHVNKILNSGARLTKEQKTFVMESIDKARSISEVRMVFETIVGSIATQAQINESRRPVPNAQRPRTSGSPNQQVLSESVDRGQKAEFSRLQQLAGLVK